jgi:hypothetical protein
MTTLGAPFGGRSGLIFGNSALRASRAIFPFAGISGMGSISRPDTSGFCAILISPFFNQILETSITVILHVLESFNSHLLSFLLIYALTWLAVITNFGYLAWLSFLSKANKTPDFPSWTTERACLSAGTVKLFDLR